MKYSILILISLLFACTGGGTDIPNMGSSGYDVALDTTVDSTNIENSYKKDTINVNYIVPTDTIISKDSVVYNNFTIDSVEIKLDSLNLFVGYGGGCKEHEFIISVINFDSTNLDSICEVYISHNDNEDMCESYIHKKISFSIVEDLKITDSKLIKILNNNEIIKYKKGE